MAEVSQTVSNPALVAAMEELQKNSSQENQAALVKELKTARFLVPVTISPALLPASPDQKIVLTEDTLISVKSLRNEAEEWFCLAFTDLESLFLWRNEPEQQTLVVTFEDLGSLVVGNQESNQGFVINPFSHNLIIRKETIRSIFAVPPAPDYLAVEKDTTVLLGEPKDYPRELTEAIGRYLAGEDRVKRAYLLLMVRGDKQSFLVVVEQEGGEENRDEHRKALYEAIGSAAEPHLKPGQYLDLVSGDSVFGRDAIQSRQPFYVKP